METINEYLEALEKAEKEQDVEKQFELLCKITDHYYSQPDSTSEIIKYLNLRESLAKQTHKLDQEFAALQCFVEVYELEYNPQLELEYRKKAHDVAVQIKGLDDSSFDSSDVKEKILTFMDDFIKVNNECMSSLESRLEDINSSNDGNGAKIAFYSVKLRKTVYVDVSKVQKVMLKNGRPAASAIDPYTGTRMFKVLSAADAALLG